MSASRLSRVRRRILVRVPLLLLVVVAIVVAARQGHRVLTAPTEAPHLRLGAGHVEDEASVVATALGELATELPLDIVHTDGTLDNVDRLVRGELDLATVQADTPLPPDLRLVAVLYSDVYFLVVRQEAEATHLTHLAGGTIATAEAGSAQALSLARVLDHYGLKGAVDIVHTADATADQMLEDGRVDAIFRVRSVHNQGLHALAHVVPVRLLPIDHGPALQATDPALHPATIPAGVVRGWPAVPSVPTASVQVHRLLVAHNNVPDTSIRALAQLLFEHRQALVRRTPIAAGITPPARSVANAAPLHAGVEAWLDRAEPSYLEKNADYVSLLMSTVLLLGSWAWAGRTFVARRMQKRADHHHHVLLDILRTIDTAADAATLAEQKVRLIRILEEVLDDVETEAISPAHFQGFALGWEAAHRTLADRERSLPSPP